MYILANIVGKAVKDIASENGIQLGLFAMNDNQSKKEVAVSKAVKQWNKKKRDKSGGEKNNPWVETLSPNQPIPVFMLADKLTHTDPKITQRIKELGLK